MATLGPVFCLLLRVSSDYAQPITGQVTELTRPVIGRAQPELTPSKGQKTGLGHNELNQVKNKLRPWMDGWNCSRHRYELARISTRAPGGLQPDALPTESQEIPEKSRGITFMCKSLYSDVVMSKMGVSNHQPYDCLLNRLFRHRSKKTSKLRVTGLCEGNSPGPENSLHKRASNVENVSIWWRHHV